MSIRTRTGALQYAAAVGVVTLVLVVAGCGGSDKKAAASTASASASAPATTTTAPPGTAVAFEAPPAAVSPLTPVCLPADPAECLTPLTYAAADFHGDLTGTSVGAGAASITTDPAYGSALFTFQGTVTACGTGRVLTLVSGGLSSGDWKFIEKSGTNELASMTGGGTYTIDAAGSHFTGELHCK